MSRTTGAGERDQGIAPLYLRDVFDTRPTLAREGGREVAMDDHGVRRIPATWRWGYVGATFTAAGVSTAMIYSLSGALCRSDFAQCPFHAGIWICSYCCMSELQCGTMCRTDAAPVVRAPVLQQD